MGGGGIGGDTLDFHDHVILATCLTPFLEFEAWLVPPVLRRDKKAVALGEGFSGPCSAL